MCGIFGLINKDQSLFNKGVFNTLGIANDSRGGDSCGIFIDGKSEYGVDKNKLYSDFFLKSELIKNTSTCKIAIGHCRKTSVGKTSLETAQPVIIKENDEVKYVLMHNGTIFNYEALAKKYIPEIDIKGMSDSQVMARIFYYKGYEALSEYNGGAVFVIVDYRQNKDNPEIFFWKGESKKTKYAKVEFDERPFYFVSKNGKFIFSSISQYLEGFVNEECYTIKSNALIKYIDGEIFIHKEYSRKDCQQDKEYPTNTKPYNPPAQTSSGWGSNSYIYTGKFGEYKLRGKNLHGEVFCSAYGIVFENPFNSPNSCYFYFYNGVLLYNKSCFELIEIIRKYFETTIPEYSDFEVFCRDYPEIITYFSYNPLTMDESKTYLRVDENLNWNKFTGEFHHVLTDYGIIKCVNGKEISKTHTNALQSFEYFKVASSSFYINKESFIDLINNNYGVSIRLS